MFIRICAPCCVIQLEAAPPLEVMRAGRRRPWHRCLTVSKRSPRSCTKDGQCNTCVVRACVSVRACTSARMSGGGLVWRGGNVFKRVTVTLKLDRSCSVQYSGKIPFNIYIGGPEVKTPACSQQHQCVCVNGVFH